MTREVETTAWQALVSASGAYFWFANHRFSALILCAFGPRSEFEQTGGAEK